MSAPASGDPRDRVYGLRARAAQLRAQTVCACEGRETYPCDGRGACADPLELEHQAAELERLAWELDRQLRRRARPTRSAGSST